jgi:hypothetical protein
VESDRAKVSQCAWELGGVPSVSMVIASLIFAAQRHIPTHLFLFPLLVFLSLWTLLPLVISYVSGWASLAEQYRLCETFSGSRWSWQSAQMRFMMNYKRCLTVGASEQGLYLAMNPPFRVGHRYSSRGMKSLWKTYRKCSLPVLDFSWAEKSLFHFGSGRNWPTD